MVRKVDYMNSDELSLIYDLKNRGDESYGNSDAERVLCDVAQNAYDIYSRCAGVQGYVVRYGRWYYVAELCECSAMEAETVANVFENMSFEALIVDAFGGVLVLHEIDIDAILWSDIVDKIIKIGRINK